MRDYVNAHGQVRRFDTDQDHVEHDGVIWARIPTPETLKERLALAIGFGETKGQHYEPEDFDIFVAVPDGEGGFLEVPMELTEHGWRSKGPGIRRPK